MKDLFTDVEGPLSVGELTQAIRDHLANEFSSVWVTGEITGVRKHQASGHCYFTMKDASATLPAVMWRSALARLKFQLSDGMDVVARGKLNVYPPQGKYQLEVDSLEPKGIGSREIALRQLREKLFAKGYFDPARKRKLPAFAKRIALVTSPSGAAVRDMLQILMSRWPIGEVIICPVRVQGDEAAREIAAAIRLINRLHLDRLMNVDVLIVGRGGGSVEDLWAFNEEIVADAVFASQIPVVSAVGHEIDFSVSDQVADVHALTPTDAAVRVVPDRADLVRALRLIRNRMEEAMQRRVAACRQALDAIRARSAFQRPLARIREREERLDELATRLHRAIKLKMRRAAESVAAMSGKLETLSPLNVLRRGYSLTRTEDSSELVYDSARVRPGDRLLIQVARGTIVTRVEEIRN